MSRHPDLIEQLRRAIRDSGQSQRAIAEAVGVSQPNLSTFLAGKRGMSLETAAAICAFLKIDLTPRK